MKNKLNIEYQFTFVVFALLVIYAFWFATEASTNLLRGDDWRFLLIFYKKWLDGTFQFSDLFSDHHPIALHPLVYIVNAVYFSLERVYGAWLGLIIKTFTGVLLLWELFRNEISVSSKVLAVLFPLFIIMLFFGMNEVTEYVWPLLTYESSMTFFCGLVTLVVLDALLTSGNVRWVKAFFLILVAMLSLFLMGTLIKLFYLASLLVLLMVVIAERKVTANIVLSAFVICLALVLHTVFISSLDLPKGNDFNITLTSVVDLMTNLFDNMSFVAFGLAAGITNAKFLDYPSVTLDIFSAGCLILVGYSVFVFHQVRMWKFTIIPMVLVVYMLLVFLGAIVFRNAEAVSNTWPLYIPRYFPAYHMGWIGVTWIYCYKLRLTSKRGMVLAIAAPLLLGIFLMLLGLKHAWNFKPYIESSNLKAEISVCKYASGDLAAETNIPMWIRGHSFSQEGILLLKENKLNIFSGDTLGYRCTDLLNN